MRGIGDIFQVLSMWLPPWGVALLLGAIALALLPGLRFRTRSRQVREAVRRMVRATPADREALVTRAFDRAGNHPHLLAILATEARKRAMPHLYQRAMDALRAAPGGAAEAARLHAEASRAKGDPLHPLEVVLRVETMLDEGLTVAARVRLDEALGHHPGHPELLALLARLDATAPPLDSEGV